MTVSYRELYIVIYILCTNHNDIAYWTTVFFLPRQSSIINMYIERAVMKQVTCSNISSTSTKEHSTMTICKCIINNCVSTHLEKKGLSDYF